MLPAGRHPYSKHKPEYDKNRLVNLERKIRASYPNYQFYLPIVDQWFNSVDKKMVGDVKIGAGVIAKFLKAGKQLKFYKTKPNSTCKWDNTRLMLAAEWNAFCENFESIAKHVIPEFDPIVHSFLIPRPIVSPPRTYVLPQINTSTRNDINIINHEAENPTYQNEGPDLNDNAENQISQDGLPDLDQSDTFFGDANNLYNALNNNNVDLNFTNNGPNSNNNNSNFNYDVLDPDFINPFNPDQDFDPFNPWG